MVFIDRHLHIFYTYEPTPYLILDLLFTQYPFDKHDHFIYFGYGKGRVVIIMAAAHSCSNITGYEIDSYLHNVALNNIQAYQQKHPCSVNMKIYNMDAQKANIDFRANKFFFFNPFHPKVHIRVIQKILLSLDKHTRPATFFIYAPKKPVLEHLNSLGCLELVDIMENTRITKSQTARYYEYAVYMTK